MTPIFVNSAQYCHLLEAQVDLSKPGMYDSICKGTLEDKAQAVREAISFDFDLHSILLYATNEQGQIGLRPKNDSGVTNEQWAERLFRKSVPVDDIAFLCEVLNPDPEARWTAPEIIATGYLEIE